MEFRPELSEAEKLDLLAQAGAVCGVSWWTLWCATRYGEWPLPPHYAHVAARCGWPVAGREGETC